MDKLFICTSLFLILAACKSNRPADDNAGIQYQGDTIRVAPQSTTQSKIKLYTVTEQDYSAEFNTTGIVRAISGQLAEIAPPFDGRITRTFVRLGQHVNAGSPIFELHSADFFEATKSYFQSLQTKKLKELNFRRQKDLVQNGVGVPKELEEAEADYEIALKDYEQTSAALRMFNIRPEEITMGQPLTITSPISGEVVQTSIVIGQYVKSDAAPLAVVAELSQVWVVAQVKEKYIHAIHPDDQVEIRTDADPDEPISGRVSHISELLDEETRSVQVLITCDNKDRRLKPGMFTSVHFINLPQKSILVPSSALLQTENHTYVFVQAAEGCYVKRPVKAVTARDHASLITEGLQPGDTIVSEGSIYLMAN